MNVAALPIEVVRAAGRLEETFPGRVILEAHEPAGAIVRIRGVQLGARWSAATGDLWFAIPFHYPDAAIYPYYVTGAAPSTLGGALQSVNWRGLAATQVSLRHTAWDPARDTAVGSVLQAQAWLRAS